VSISGDTIVVGVYWEDSSASGVNGTQTDNHASNSGAAYVFVRNGDIWVQQAYLTANEFSSRFGRAVVVGKFVVVGECGSVFVVVIVVPVVTTKYNPRNNYNYKIHRDFRNHKHYRYYRNSMHCYRNSRHFS
jgi:hypothetical protein